MSGLEQGMRRMHIAWVASARLLWPGNALARLAAYQVKLRSMHGVKPRLNPGQTNAHPTCE